MKRPIAVRIGLALFLLAFTYFMNWYYDINPDAKLASMRGVSSVIFVGCAILFIISCFTDDIDNE